MASVISVSVPDDLFSRWKESGLEVSPSRIFQTALETSLGNTGRAMNHWSERALKAERKLKMISKLVDGDDREVKKFLRFEDDR